MSNPTLESGNPDIAYDADYSTRFNLPSLNSSPVMPQSFAPYQSINATPTSFSNSQDASFTQTLNRNEDSRNTEFHAGIYNPNFIGYHSTDNVSSTGGRSDRTQVGHPHNSAATLPPGTDKTPLINESDFLRSLSCAITRPGLFDLNMYRFGLSTFSGVFCPVALSMLSVLLYLRLGFVVGQAGVLLSLVILLLAYGIILLTGLSLCAISTNGAIEGGGVYYMISRALGPEFGGSIGVLFFVANVFSCALSLAGLSEVMINNFGPGGYMVSQSEHTLPTGHWYHVAYAFCISFVTLVVCLVGASLFAKTSLITLIVVSVTYLSFLLSLIINNNVMPVAIPHDNPLSNLSGFFNYTGIRSSTFVENLYPQWTHDYTTLMPMTFALVFGVVFSGVTGLMAGANMSGDLKMPDISIPKGTLQATVATLVVYLVTALLLGACCSRDLLVNDYTVMQNINIWPPFIFIGIFATSLASGMSNLIGASRVLNRVAEDKLFGFVLYPFLKRVCGNNPVYSVLLAWILVVGVLLIGALNTIARLTSVFFLLSYAGVNLACLALELTSAPNFRPTFNYFSWHTAFLGFLSSITMMFVINPEASGVAIISLLLLLIGLHYKAPPASWGSISQALIFHQVRKYLLLLDTRKEHVKYWRPQILFLVANPKSCLPLIDFVNDLKKSGLYILGHVKLVKQEQIDSVFNPLQDDMPYWLSLVDYLKIKAFVDITVSHSIKEGVQHLVRLSGLGAMKPNTVVLGFHDTAPKLDTFRDSNFLVSKKHLKFAKLDRAEVVEYFTARDLNTPVSGSSSSFFDSSDSNDDFSARLAPSDYVKVVVDILRMNKNICLARHFYKLNKDVLYKDDSGLSMPSSRRRQDRYVDVWPVDLVRPQNASTSWDNSSLFLLQLACILSMVDVWKAKTTLRVFLCVTSLQDMQRKERQLKEMLAQLRIQAKSILLPWDHVICHLSDDGEQTNDSVNKLPETYLRSFNDMLQKNSGQSTVIFLNMPLPPNFSASTLPSESASESHVESEYEKYLKCLEILTDHLPPVLLVHGISSVISTAL